MGFGAGLKKSPKMQSRKIRSKIYTEVLNRHEVLNLKGSKSCKWHLQKEKGKSGLENILIHLMK